MGLLDLLFPKNCLGCNQPGRYFCPDCVNEMVRLKLVCPVCEKPEPFGQTHHRCRSAYCPDGLVSFFDYGGLVQKAIHRLKYRHEFSLITDLTVLIVQSIENSHYLAFQKFLSGKPTVIPIPLFWYRHNTRGFNQASLFGNNLAALWVLPFNDTILTRTRPTVSQTSLPEKERRNNVQGVFSVKTNLSPENVVIVDDVWTTGATIKEATQVLKHSGVKKVWALTLAR